MLFLFFTNAFPSYSLMLFLLLNQMLELTNMAAFLDQLALCSVYSEACVIGRIPHQSVI